MFKHLKIAVIGDNLVDIAEQGSCNRVSPEAPILVLHTQHLDREITPGGSLNVGYQFKHLDAEVISFGLIDEEARNWFSNLDLSGCIHSEVPIPRKIRFYDDDRPLLRYDIEDINIPNIEDKRQEIIKLFKKNTFDVIVLSNYNKGLFSQEFAQELIKLNIVNGNDWPNIPIIVDPKCNIHFWKNCTVFKPNSKEAFDLTGEKDWKKQADILMRETECQSVVITQSGDGVVGKIQSKYFEYRPIRKSKEVNSTVGGGDAFTAFLAMGVGSGLDIEESVRYAFEAGTEYVKNKHNRPITMYELNRRIDSISAKIITVEELLKLKNTIYKDDKFILTMGCFDGGLTRGHVRQLQKSKSLGDKLIVAINADNYIIKYKNRLPIMSLKERMEVLAGLDSVDFIISFEEETPIELIKQIMPNLITKGGDYLPENVAGYGIVPIYITEKYESMSTTDKFNKL